jgi:hypothetical protein
MVQLPLNHAIELTAIDTDLVENRLDHAFVLRQQSREEMQWIDLRVAGFGRQLLSALYGFLSLQGELVETKCHVCNDE